MCGIVGIVGGAQADGRASLHAILAMTDSLEHRGPDDSGTWVSSNHGVAFGHRRLAIRDLTPTGHQPMVSRSGRFVIVYNGEVYSHDELRRDLEARGVQLRGSSDTEVILEACEAFGIRATVQRLIGMFAFAVFDRETMETTLVRDRLGIKPLYWSETSGVLLFGSELKALRRHPNFNSRLDRGSVASFLRHNYVPNPWSIYSEARKLSPGHLLVKSSNGSVTVERYWDLRAVAHRGTLMRGPEPENEALGALNDLLSDAVRRRLVADVPIGSLLSGGIDSSLVTALMVENSSSPVSTFSIGFDAEGYDEAPYAAAIARHLGTDHVELYAEAENALPLVESLPLIYDEPFADSSQLPTLLVSQLTRRNVKVVMTGDGGDEVFAGYSRYQAGLRLEQGSQLLSRRGHRLLRSALAHLPSGWLEGASRRAPRILRRPQAASKLEALAKHGEAASGSTAYRAMLSHWQNPNELVIGGSEHRGLLWDAEMDIEFPEMLDRMQVIDTLTYLPDDILVKVDRASMSVGLEARVPLLDHRVLEMAWGLDQSLKFRDGTGKWALRELLSQRVPRGLFERPKMGFGVPIEHWLRGPLREWAEDLLSHERLLRQGLLNPEPIRRRWEQHLSGENWAYPLWNVLMLEAWLDENSETII